VFAAINTDANKVIFFMMNMYGVNIAQN